MLSYLQTNQTSSTAMHLFDMTEIDRHNSDTWQLPYCKRLSEFHHTMADSSP